MLKKIIPILSCLALAACAGVSRTHMMETTAYCPCGACNGFVRGHWYFLKLDFWDKWNPETGESVSGDTASGVDFQPPRPGLFSVNTLTHPWMLPFRIVFPWLWLPARGTIAADTAYYPFGTKMTVPGWGKGVVADRGRAIKGPERLDLLFAWHWQSEDWGRRKVEVRIED